MQLFKSLTYALQISISRKLIIVDPEQTLRLLNYRHIPILFKNHCNIRNSHQFFRILNLKLKTVFIDSLLVSLIIKCSLSGLFEIKARFFFHIEHDLWLVLLQWFKTNWFVLKCAVMHTLRLRFFRLTHWYDYLSNFNEFGKTSKYKSCHESVITSVMTLLCHFIIQKLIVWLFKLELQVVWKLFIWNTFLIKVLKLCLAEISCFTAKDFCIINHGENRFYFCCPLLIGIRERFNKHMG